MPVQWFPGHMAKTRRLMKEHLSKVDLVIEILDARAPLSTTNPLLAEIRGSRPRIVLLNKEDLADPAVTTAWADYFRKSDRNTRVLPVSASRRGTLRKIPSAALALCGDSARVRRRGPRAMVAGIPNVGKSTLINALARRHKAETGDRPGVTRDVQWVPADGRLRLLDTPGLLWHKFDDPLVGYRLAVIGAIKDEILPLEEVGRAAASYIGARYPDSLRARYDFEDIPNDPWLLLEHIGRRRGCLVAGGRVDREKASRVFLKDLREGRLGRLSVEEPAGDLWCGLNLIQDGR